MAENAPHYHVAVEYRATGAVFYRWHGLAWDALEAAQLATQATHGAPGPQSAVQEDLVIRVHAGWPPPEGSPDA